jgi:hypothetical protein
MDGHNERIWIVVTGSIGNGLKFFGPFTEGEAWTVNADLMYEGRPRDEGLDFVRVVRLLETFHHTILERVQKLERDDLDLQGPSGSASLGVS